MTMKDGVGGEYNNPALLDGKAYVQKATGSLGVSIRRQNAHC